MMMVKFANLVLPKCTARFAFLSLLWVVALSFLFAKYEAPKTYLASVRNPLHLFLIKPSLYITVAVALLFAFATHYPLNNGCLRPTLLPVYRLLFAVALYLCILAGCRMLGERYAIGSFAVECVSHQNGTRCWEQLERWFPITISGHLFTMLCSLLVVAEETAIYGQWKKIEDTILATEESRCCAIHLLDESKLISRCLFVKYSPFVKCLYVFLACWSLFLHFSTLVTIAYFRQPYEKIAGALLALLHWQLTYRFVCCSEHIAAEVKKFEHKSVKRYRTVDY